MVVKGSKTERKIAYDQKLCKLLDEYRQILVVAADNVGSNQLQNIRRGLRGDSVVLMGKNTMMKRTIRLHAETSGNQDFLNLIPLLVGNVGLIFTKGDLKEVSEVVAKYKVGAPARVGLVAPIDVVVQPGNTGLDPSQTSFFQILNIPTKINKGTVEPSARELPFGDPMAVSSISATLSLLPTCGSSISARPKSLCFAVSSNVLKQQTLKHSHTSRVLAAPELLESEDTLESPPEILDSPDSDTFEVGVSETPASSSLTIGADVDKMAPKQKIRIKLRSYWVPLIEDSCKQIIDAARTSNAKTMGPVPLPTKKRIYCVLKSPHVHKDARFHFEIRTHQRLIDILYPTAQTIDSLMQLDLPAGVDVEVKI